MAAAKRILITGATGQQGGAIAAALAGHFAAMLEWFDRVGYDADIPALEREFGIRPTTIKAWAAQRGQTA